MKTGISLFALLFVCGSLSACSKTNILNNVDVKVTSQNSDQFIALSAKLNLGNAVFDQVQIPVKDPHTGLEVGYLGLAAGADGSQTVSLGVNASAALHADRTLGATLPNGRELPQSLGVNASEMLAFPVLNYSRIYIGGDLKNQVVIGVALAVKALDGVANVAGMPANIFFGQQVDPSLYGLAGLYGSPNANESGIAVFGRLQLRPSAQPGGVLTLAKQAISKVQESASGLAGAISDQATSDADELHPRSERKVTNFFYGRPRVIQVQ